MHERKSRLFEKFDRTPLTRGTASAAPSVVIRAAKAADAAEIGQISADREGRDLFDAVADVRRALNDPKMGHDRLLLVAEFRDCVVGFGKVQSLGAKGTTNECALPCGWYLTGIVVDPAFRRRGVGARLTAARLQWIAERSSTAYYFANARNLVSIALHDAAGFVEIARAATFGNVKFAGGEGVLFKAELGG